MLKRESCVAPRPCSVFLLFQCLAVHTYAHGSRDTNSHLSTCQVLAREREPGKRRSGRLSAPVAGTPNNGQAAVWRAPDTPTTAGRGRGIGAVAPRLVALDLARRNTHRAHSKIPVSLWQALNARRQTGNQSNTPQRRRTLLSKKSGSDRSPRKRLLVLHRPRNTNKKNRRAVTFSRTPDH